MWSMFSLLTDATLINMELVSKYSSLRTISMYLSYITTNDKKRGLLCQQFTSTPEMTKPEHNGRQFEDNILKCICMKETFCILQILQKFLEVQLTINPHWFGQLINIK